MDDTASPPRAPLYPPATNGFAATADALFRASQTILAELEHGRVINASMLRFAMESAFSGSDAEGLWDWKLAYEAGEAAQILFLRKYGKAMFRNAASPAGVNRPGFLGGSYL